MITFIRNLDLRVRSLVLRVRSLVLRVRSLVLRVRSLVLRVRNLFLRVRNLFLRVRIFVLRVRNLFYNFKNLFFRVGGLFFRVRNFDFFGLLWLGFLIFQLNQNFHRNRMHILQFQNGGKVFWFPQTLFKLCQKLFQSPLWPRIQSRVQHTHSFPVPDFLLILEVINFLNLWFVIL